jgi:hypothetical protein
MSMSRALDYATVIKNLDPDGSVFVLNQTGNSNASGDLKNPASLVLSIRKEDGDLVTISIPKSWVPMDLSTHIHASYLKKSSDFRRLVSKGFLKILSAEEALSILEQPDADMEISRLANRAEAASLQDKVDSEQSIIDEVEEPLVTVFANFKAGKYTEQQVLKYVEQLGPVTSENTLTTLLNINTSESISKLLARTIKAMREKQ